MNIDEKRYEYIMTRLEKKHPKKAKEIKAGNAKKDLTGVPICITPTGEEPEIEFAEGE